MNKSHRSVVITNFQLKFDELRSDIRRDPARTADILNQFFEEYADF